MERGPTHITNWIMGLIHQASVSVRIQLRSYTQHVTSTGPQFIQYISSIRMSTLCYMNEINLQEGRQIFYFSKSDMFPPGVRKWFASSLLRSSSSSVRNQALWYHDSLAA